jgi:hypothetical protein
MSDSDYAQGYADGVRDQQVRITELNDMLNEVVGAYDPYSTLRSILAVMKEI